MTDAERIEALEFKLAHLERGLQELSDVVVGQQQQIEELRLQNRRLVAQIAELIGGIEPPQSDEVPPHY